MKTKKYISLRELSSFLNVPIHKIRSLEKTHTGLKIYKINNRRFYTKSDVIKIKSLLCNKVYKNFDNKLKIKSKTIKALANSKTTNLILRSFQERNQNCSKIVNKIDQLIQKFTYLYDKCFK